MNIETLFDQATYTLTYVVYDEQTRDAIVIDPVLDYDPLSSSTATRSLERLEAFLKEKSLRVHYVLETHAHADHISGSQYLKRRFDARVAIGERITEVQETFKKVFDLPASFRTDGGQFDQLLRDGQKISAGSLDIEVIATPGHTPACVSFKIEDAVFTGDALFIEDYGTGRCDFPRGSAEDLYASIHDKLYTLPDATRVFVGHDYQPGGRPLRYETTIGASKQANIQLKAETTRDQFVAFRKARDAKLEAPRLLYPSVQVNVDAGRLPAAASNGLRYLRVPLNLKRPTEEDGTPRPLLSNNEPAMTPTRLALVLIASALAASCKGKPPLDEARATERGKAVAGPFKQTLKNTLMGAIQKGGPDQAIEVCAEQAPKLAAEASTNGVKLGRASTRLRNPANAPPAWVSPLLDDLAKTSKADGTSRVVSLPDGRVGYVEALHIAQPCLTCHGNPQGDLEKKLKARYPADAATGYALGDLRGVVWVEMPGG